MERQVISFIVFVLMAVSVPVILVSGPDWWHRLAGAFSSAATNPSVKAPTEAKPGQEAGPSTQEAESAAVLAAKKTPLTWDQIFRFDITPEEIVRLFPRVSVGLGTLQLQGYRVPLVTGTRPEDLAGSLTYYFNARGQVELIEFVGTTGAAGPFVTFCYRRFGLAQRVTNSPGVFVYEKPHSPRGRQSTLVIRPAPVLQADQAYARFNLELKLFREAAEEMAGSLAPVLGPDCPSSLTGYGSRF